MSKTIKNSNDNANSGDKEIELRRARRLRAALERLGTNNPRCLYCAETDPHVLEKHHLRGRHFGDETVIVCRNHHRKLSNLQRDHTQPIYAQPDPREAIAHFLDGLADLFEMLIIKLREFSKYLIELADDNAGNVEGAP